MSGPGGTAVFRLSACIEWLFAEEPRMADRIRLAAAAGLASVEFWTWRDKDLTAIEAALAETGVHLEAFVSEPVGRLVDTRTHDTFAAGIAESCRAANLLGCSKLIVLAGDAMADIDGESQHRAVVASLRRTAPIAADHGITLLLEPLNTTVDHVGHFLDSTRQGLAMIEEIDAPNVRLLLDLYHSAVMGEQLDERVGDRMGLIGHVHIADAPGRHEPGTGEIDWARTIDWLRRNRYAGRLGLEYQPTADTGSSLSFLKEVVRSR